MQEWFGEDMKNRKSKREPSRDAEREKRLYWNKLFLSLFNINITVRNPDDKGYEEPIIFTNVTAIFTDAPIGAVKSAVADALDQAESMGYIVPKWKTWYLPR